MEPNRPNQQNQQNIKKDSGTLWTIIGIIVVIAIILAIYFITPKSRQEVDMTSQPSSELEIKAGEAVTVSPTALTVINSGTFPYKVQAKASFDLPNSCSTATSNVSQSGKVFTVTVSATQPTGAMCAQVMTPTTLTVDIPVAGLSAGTYTVNYAGLTKTFTLAQNNQVDFVSDK